MKFAIAQCHVGLSATKGRAGNLTAPPGPQFRGVEGNGQNATRQEAQSELQATAGSASTVGGSGFQNAATG